jgi:hypothetical protein
MNVRATLRVAAVLGVCLVLTASRAHADNITWASAVSGDWSDSTKWSPMQVPDGDDLALINIAGTYTVTLDQDAEVGRILLGNSSGAQTLALDGRHLQLNAAAPATSVSGGAVLDVKNGSLIDGAGQINVFSQFKLTDSDLALRVNLSGGALVINGTSSHTGIFNLNSGGSLNVQSGMFTIADPFTANGSISLSGAGSALSVTNGTLTIGSTGSLNSIGTGSTRVLDAQINNQGTIVVAADLHINRGDANHVNSGLITCSVGSLSVIQTGDNPSFTNTGTMAISVSATFTGGTVQNSGSGLIRGGGLLNVSDAIFTNSADIAPGSSAGLLSLSGNYQQSAPGTYRCELGGLVAGSSHDQLVVIGSADLNGELAVSLINGFIPAPGDSFVILTYDSFTGAFADTSSLEGIAPGIDLVQDYQANQLVLHAVEVPLADNIAPLDPGICITPSNPCLTIPFQFHRTVSTPVRAFTVTFSLSPSLELCNGLASITEGTYLSAFCGGGCTAFQKNDNGDGTYTVDCAILGSNCGPTGTPGDLFSIQVQSAGETEASGAVTVISTTVRDCDNAPVPAEPGPPTLLVIDATVPVAIADLTVSQIVSDNDSDGTTGIDVSFSTSEGGVQVYRKGYGDYPEYADGGVPTVPATPAAALADGWVLTDITGSGQIDEPPARDYWYYVAFIVSPCALVSPPSNMTGGTLNYHLGDVSDGAVPCQGDNSVGSVDLSFLGAHYFTSGAGVDPVNCLDVGPTDDFSPDGLPRPDDVIGFEDLLMFAINFGQVSRPESGRDEHASREAASLLLFGGESDGVFTARLTLDGNQAVKGAHAVIEYDPASLELLGVERGSLFDRRQQGPVFFQHEDKGGSITIDTAVMGRGAAIEGSGEIAELRFRMLDGNAQLDLATADLRDLYNRPLGPEVDSAPPVEAPALPRVTSLLGARPNPANGHADIWFQLAEEASVRLDVYDISGRQIRSLDERVLPAGEHSIRWDGKDDAGHSVGSGIYFYTFRSGAQVETRKLYLSR